MNVSGEIKRRQASGRSFFVPPAEVGGLKNALRVARIFWFDRDNRKMEAGAKIPWIAGLFRMFKVFKAELNLEHVFCTDPELLKAYYYLMQIAHMIMQIFEASSLLRQLARECGQTPWQLFGSLKNLARRLLECFRYFALSAAAFASGQAHRIYFHVDSS